MFYAVRTDLNGDTVWTHYYSHPYYEWTSLSHGSQSARDVIWAGNEPYQTKFAIIGETAFPESLGSKYAAWLVLISDTCRGDTVWTKTYDTYFEQLPTSIVLCEDGGFAIAGYADDTLLLPHGQDFWLLRVDSLGNNIPSEIHEKVTVPEISSLIIQPNPFNSSCKISAPEGAELQIFDINGRNLAHFPGGTQIWRPDNSVGSGIYLVRAKMGDKEITKRVVYLK
jgi:hypothetical protein